jgi:electron transport complex protein RnfG
MKTILITGIKLFAICAVAALALGAVNSVTEPRIAQYKIEQLRQALAELTPGATTGDPVEVAVNPTVVTRYQVLENGREVGSVLELVGVGYGGELRILARYADSGEILAARLMEDEETPGLGKKAESPEYMQKFLGTGTAGDPVPVRKDMLSAGEADAVTGATITFLGVAKALAEGSRFVRQGRQ